MKTVLRKRRQSQIENEKKRIQAEIAKHEKTLTQTSRKPPTRTTETALAVPPTASPKAPRPDAAAQKRREVEALYTTYNPEKLADVDKLLAKYGADKLLAMVRKKYARREVEALYGKHNPEKLVKISEFMNAMSLAAKRQREEREELSRT